MLTLTVEIRVQSAGREELLEALRVLFGELSREPTFVDAEVGTSDDEPDLIMVIERWRETKQSFVRDRLKHPAYRPYLDVFERVGISRTPHWLQNRQSWRAE